MCKLSNLSPFGNLSHRVFFSVDLFFRCRRPINITGGVAGNPWFHSIELYCVKAEKGQSCDFKEPTRLFCTLSLYCSWHVRSQILRGQKPHGSLSARPKHCDVENCENCNWKKGKFENKGQTYCVAGAPNDVSFENNTHITGISIHSFPKDVTVSLWPHWTRFIRRHRGDFILRCRPNMLCNGLEDSCYEHIPQVKSGKDNQWIQLKIILIKGPVPTPYTIAQHSFRLTFRKRRMVSSLLLFIPRAWDLLILLVFNITTFALFLSYENPINGSFHRILTTQIHSL